MSKCNCTIVIFGASGDLSQRKLVPALYQLTANGLLGRDLQVIGIGRTEFSDDQFCQHLQEETAELPGFRQQDWDAFSKQLSYLSGGYDDPETYQRLRERLEANGGEGDQNRLFYLAVPPNVYTHVIEQIGDAGLNRTEGGFTHIIIEKPFGHDLESARQLNEQVHACFEENQIYRIDHYLGKETVQNILAFRFANFIFDEMWGHKYIDHVQITAAETDRVEKRAGYYEENGAVRDMLQNHMLQLLTLICMEPPIAMNAKELRDEKVKVLRTLRQPDLEDVVFGQYKGYREEEGVDPNSTTPTYTALKLFVDNRRWAGVPFYLRTGKALSAKVTEITIQFKHVPNPIFKKRSEPHSNRISFCIQPDEGIHLNFQLKEPGGEMITAPVAMNFHYRELIGDQPLPEAYERLILDAIQGEPSLFARSDEIEQAWELVSGLLDNSKAPLVTYAPGSWGPEEGNALIEDDGRTWMHCCNHPEEEEKD